MMQQRQKQRPQLRTHTEINTATHFSVPAVSVHDTEIQVELVRTEMVAEGRIDVAETEQQSLQFSESADTITFSIPTTDAIYQSVRTAWDTIAAALIPDQAVIHAHSPLIQEDDQPQVRPASTPRLDYQRPFACTPRHDPAPSVTADHDTAYMTQPVSTPVPEPREQQRPVPQIPVPDIREADSMSVQAHYPVSRASLEPQQVQRTADTITYTVQTAGTVMESLLELDADTPLDVTVVRQPFYSPHSFTVDGEDQLAGWHDAYWIVQLDDLDVRKTEFSYLHQGRESLGTQGIADAQVTPGQEIVWRESDDYTCGAYTPDEQTVAAWEETYRWFDDDLERSVYAALVDGNPFYGSAYDLAAHDMDAVRDAYIEDVGVAPENVFDNVTYSG